MAKQKPVYWHPSGPELKGQPHCAPGMIYSHQLHKCISIFTKGQKRKTIVKGVS